jgi:hypothetical protein
MTNPTQTLRKVWQATKSGIEKSNAGNPQVKKLLTSFNQGLGPALDKFETACKAKKWADARKQGQQILAIVKDYQSKMDRLPKDAWNTNSAGKSPNREWGIATLSSMQAVIAKTVEKLPNA